MNAFLNKYSFIKKKQFLKQISFVSNTMSIKSDNFVMKSKSSMLITICMLLNIFWF